MLETSACQKKVRQKGKNHLSGILWEGCLSLARERTRNRASSINEIVMSRRPVSSMLLALLSSKAFRLKPWVDPSGKD